MATGVPKDGGVREHLFAGSASCGKDAKMENINVIGSTVPAITTETTLGELLAILNLGEKPHDTPTPKMLRETAGDPVAVSPDPLGYGDGCKVYANGYAVYDNGSGRTVVWLPDCTSFTYYFVKPKESEIGIVPENSATRYCESRFPEKYGTILDFMHVDEEDMENFGDKIEWLPEDPAVLIKKGEDCDDGSQTETD